MSTVFRIRPRRHSGRIVRWRAWALPGCPNACRWHLLSIESSEPQLSEYGTSSLPLGVRERHSTTSQAFATPNCFGMPTQMCRCPNCETLLDLRFIRYVTDRHCETEFSNPGVRSKCMRHVSDRPNHSYLYGTSSLSAPPLARSKTMVATLSRHSLSAEIASAEKTLACPPRAEFMTAASRFVAFRAEGGAR